MFVYPSLYEGFGLPCLEAMACGCPVVCSKTTSLPEVVGDAGILVDPMCDGEIAEAMYRIISGKTLREAMIARGLERAKRFTWQKTANTVLETYRKIIAQ